MLELKDEYDGNVLVLTPTGRIDGANASDYEQTLIGRIDGGDPRILIDCESVSYISSAGLRVLLMASRRADKADGQLALFAVQGHVMDVFKHSGFADIIPIHEDRAAALTAF